MDKPLPETKDETIQRLQKKLQAMELNYHDLLDNFDVRVKLTAKMMQDDKIRAIRKILK